MIRAHKILAAIVGELSLAIVRGKSPPAEVKKDWARRIRQVLEVIEGSLA